MESYRPFQPSDSSSVYERELGVPTPKGLKSTVAYVLYGVLLLLLLILLMLTGIKFSQLNKEITDVKYQLERISKAGTTSSAHSGPTVFFVSGCNEAVYKQKSEIVFPSNRIIQHLLIIIKSGSCREGWSSFQRSCYLLSTTFMTWSKAEEQCRTQGGHLVVLNNVEELDFISQIVEIKFNYWIGLVEREEDHWTWVDGTDFSTTQTFWDNGQPDNWDLRENGEDCGQLHASVIRKRKLWNDADCSLSYRYICESSI
ncbi:C-type lectin domain family 4 member E-like [Tautogolabrus adspersus]